MSDMLVKLYDLPDDRDAMTRVREQGVVIRHAMPYELSEVRAWLEQHFSTGWADEATSVWSRQPIPCLLAIADGHIVGFANYDTTCRGYFGPTGVTEPHRGRGVGVAMLHAAMRALHGMGYGYAIIGGVGPLEFYKKHINAIVIPDSEPGVYPNRLKSDAPIRHQ